MSGDQVANAAKLKSLHVATTLDALTLSADGVCKAILSTVPSAQMQAACQQVQKHFAECPPGIATAAVEKFLTFGTAQNHQAVPSASHYFRYACWAGIIAAVLCLFLQ